MCYAYYEIRTLDDGTAEILAWRDPAEIVDGKPIGGNPQYDNRPLWPIATAANYDVALAIAHRLNAGVGVDQFKDYDDDDNAVYHKPYANGFWPKPQVKLDPCTGEAVAA